MDVIEHCTGKEKLLLTTGDSWTFGDSLNNKDKDYLKTPAGTDYRKKHLWGRHLADNLGYDWVNLAEPGISNSVILDYVEQFKTSELYQKYEIVQVAVVLTETGRELQALDWKNHTKELQTSEQKIFNQIKKLVDQKISFLVARNFTYNYAETHVPNNIQFVKDNWQTVLLRTQGIDPVEISGPASGVALWIYENHNPSVIKNKDYKQFVVDTVESAQPLWDALDFSIYNYQHATRHPTEQGHEIWACYLFDNYFQNN